MRERDNRPHPFKSSHWSEFNVLAHVRFNERTGTSKRRVGETGIISTQDKVLFIEEIQSDWHQEGRKKGMREIQKDGRSERVPVLIPAGLHRNEPRRLSDRAKGLIGV